jgi:protein gp37
MSGHTNIEWTHPEGFKGESWNPFVGCSIVSKGCTNCYAMKMAARIVAMQGEASHYAGTVKTVNGKPVWTGAVRPAPDKTWTAPLRAKSPRCYFVNSMSDVFHEDVPDQWIDRLFAVMALAPQHRFLILTKRPERMRDYLDRQERRCDGEDGLSEDIIAMANEADVDWRNVVEDKWPLPNVWLGTSVEDQASADQRIPHLLATPAAIRFISAEPLLGPADLETIWIRRPGARSSSLSQSLGDYVRPLRGNFTDSPTLDWVIAGGESGPGARPCDPDWLRSLRDQCAAAQVRFFMKQMHRKGPIPDDLLVRQWPEAGR